MPSRAIALLLGIFCFVAVGEAQTAASDIDECLLSETCPAYSICSNTPGSYYCVCKPGFVSSSGEVTFTNNLTECRDIDECSQLPMPCITNSLCDNRKGGYRCRCISGYQAINLTRGLFQIPAECRDINECAENPFICGSESYATCTNTPGSYRCGCRPGYIVASHGDDNQSLVNCTEIVFRCQSDFLQERDLLRRCQDPSPQTAPGTNYTSFCMLVKSTLNVLQDPCRKDNSSVSLQKAAKGFGSVLEAASTWSNLSSEQRSTSATVFLQSVESTVLAIFARPSENGSQTIRTEFLDIQTKVIQDDECSAENPLFSLSAKGETMVIRCRTVYGTEARGLGGVAFASYVGLESILNGSFLEKNSTGNFQMNSRVAGAILARQMKTDLLDPILYTFENILQSRSSDQLYCVSWDAKARQGGWMRAGCRVLHFNATHTTCSCTHVSNLAVLMSVGEITMDFALFIITHVGLGLSLLCLLLAILTFLLCRPIRGTNTSIHMQLCLCLFLADLLFLTAVERGTSHKLACAIIAGLLHFLFLSCFSWMFLEAVVLFLTVRNLKVVNYFGTRNIKTRYLSIFGYGFPAIVVAVSAGIMPEGYGRWESCWLSPEKGFFWSFLGPVCAIIGINCILFALKLWMLRERLSALNAEVSTLKNTRLLTFKAITQVFILGCTWVLGLFQFGPLATVMAYLFTIINSLQGVFIFLVHCLLNRQVREEYRRWLTRKSKSESSAISMSTMATSSKTIMGPVAPRPR
uniref:Adhesion G protein-coupled receptor E1 n=1 Tax=Sphenodon punctatus TaxID=8508 RepID=A0A8D0GNG3_SPHPU